MIIILGLLSTSWSFDPGMKQFDLQIFWGWMVQPPLLVKRSVHGGTVGGRLIWAPTFERRIACNLPVMREITSSLVERKTFGFAGGNCDMLLGLSIDGYPASNIKVIFSGKNATAAGVEPTFGIGTRNRHKRWTRCRPHQGPVRATRQLTQRSQLTQQPNQQMLSGLAVLDKNGLQWSLAQGFSMCLCAINSDQAVPFQRRL